MRRTGPGYSTPTAGVGNVEMTGVVVACVLDMGDLALATVRVVITCLHKISDDSNSVVSKKL
jgi:hypothetical protein